MAVSTKKTKPSSPDISSGLSMLNSNPFNSSFESESSAPVSISNQQIQSGANTQKQQAFYNQKLYKISQQKIHRLFLEQPKKQKTV